MCRCRSDSLEIYKSLPKSRRWTFESHWRALTDCSQNKSACQTATPDLLSVPFPASVCALQSAAQTPTPHPLRFAMMDRAWSYPPLLLPCPLSTAEISGEERTEEKWEKRERVAEVEQKCRRKEKQGKKELHRTNVVIPRFQKDPQFRAGQGAGSSLETLPQNWIFDCMEWLRHSVCLTPPLFHFVWVEAIVKSSFLSAVV